MGNLPFYHIADGLTGLKSPGGPEYVAVGGSMPVGDEAMMGAECYFFPFPLNCPIGSITWSPFHPLT